ncbi:hypothetical protein D3C75_951700 [compost metagenome]
MFRWFLVDRHANFAIVPINKFDGVSLQDGSCLIQTEASALNLHEYVIPSLLHSFCGMRDLKYSVASSANIAHADFIRMYTVIFRNYQTCIVATIFRFHPCRIVMGNPEDNRQTISN